MEDNQIVSKKNKVIKVLLIITIVLSMIACFLPFISFEDFSMNYVYSKDSSMSKNSGIKEGVFVLVFCAISVFILLRDKGRVSVFILQLLSLGVLIFDYINMKNDLVLELIKRFSGLNVYGIGLYLLFVFLILSVILSIIRVIKKDKYD